MNNKNNINNQAYEAPDHEIRALYGDSTIRVYQAYSDGIADAALAKGTFVSPPFKMDRMTWIEPIVLDAGQKRILAIDISREGFEWALAHQLYVNEWIRGITEVTPLAKEIQALVEGQQCDQATARLPKERPYCVQSGINSPTPATAHTA